MANRSHRPFPVLALFTIYTTNNEITIEQNSDSAAGDIEGRKVLYFSAPTLEPLTAPRRNRLLGTVMGMADFAKMLSPDGPSVKSVYSLKQRMIWIEPEPGLFLHATIDLPRQVRQSRSASEANLKPVSALPLDDNSLIANLEAEYRKYKLLHGSISYAITNEPRETVMLRLSGFWNGWNSRWGLEKAETSAFETLVGGIASSTQSNPQLSPLLNQFAASNPTAKPLILCNQSTLYYPPPSTLSSSNDLRSKAPILIESDLEPLVRYLASLVTSSLSDAPPPLLAPNSPKKPKRIPKPKSTWNALTFGMGSYISPSLSTINSSMASISLLPSMAIVEMFIPPVATSTTSESRLAQSNMADNLMNSMKADSREVEKVVEKTEAKSKGWGLRNVSWSSITSISSLDVSPTPPPLQVPPEPALDSLIPQEVPNETIVSDSVANDLESITPPAPILEESPSSFESFDVYLASAQETSRLLRLERGELSVGLVVSSSVAEDDIDWLLNRSRKLLEAIEVILESSPISVPFPHRFLSKKLLSLDVSGWIPSSLTAATGTWSGSATAEENETLSALISAHRLQSGRSQIFETFIRTSKNWVVSRKEKEIGEVYLVLPPRVGVEGSLLDAAEQLRALETHLHSINT